MDPRGPLAGARPAIIICTRDRAQSEPFYRDVLGLQRVGQDNFAVIFDIGGAPLRLSTVADWKPQEHTIFGFTVDDIDRVVVSLAERGVAFDRHDGFNHDTNGVWTAPDRSARVAWFKDPDGNLLSISQFA